MSIDITWVDGFVASISHYIYVRRRDSLLILLPNQAYKLNRTGRELLDRTIRGQSIVSVLESRKVGSSKDEQVLDDVHSFFCDLRSLVMGCLGEGTGRRAVEEAPFERPHNLLPVLSEIALTYRCNLSCRFCYAGCRCRADSHESTKDRRHEGRPFSFRRSVTEGEMSTQQVRRVLGIIRRDADVPSVSWTGGEPTLRDDLVELTRYAVEIGLRVNLITNATMLTPRLVRDLREAGLSSAQVSLEGPDAQVHDSLTRVSGSFDRTVAGLGLLQDAGLHVHTNTTVNRVNAPHLEGIVDLAMELGMKRLSMNMVIPCGAATAPASLPTRRGQNGGAGPLTMTYTHIAPIVEQVRRKARAAGIQFTWYSPTPYCIYNPVAAGLGGKSCAACDGLLSVAPDGEVLPCSSLPEGVGNLLTSGFDRVWNSRRARYWREKRYAHRLCRACEQFDLCTGACPIYWKAMGCRELTVREAVA